MAVSILEREIHKVWMGLIQPVGLVVSPPALAAAQVVPDQNTAALLIALQGALTRGRADADPLLLDFPRFAVDVLGWAPQDLAGAPGGPPLPDALAVVLPDHGETLRPTYAALDGLGDGRPLLLVSVVPRNARLDAPPPDDAPGWPASPQARLERLLRDTGVPAGLLCNGAELRLVYAPRGESSGHLGFPVAELVKVSGRPLLAALHMLLGEHRVFGAADGQRLQDILVQSRRYQSEVSNRLAEQVLGALWELLRGYQAADEAAHGRVLFDLPRADPQHVYGGLLTVIMRLVFLLYAEDQGLMPDDPVYQRNYAIGGLFERLREDAGRYPDTLDQRFGALAWLLTTFRLVYDGGGHGSLRLPARHGQLFDPDAWPFLEGRPPDVRRVLGQPIEAPRVSDGTLWRVLERLLMLDGERLSYRALDVEQIGSVYESMMGFDVATLPGRALAVRPRGVVIDVDALLGQPAARRAAWLKEQADCDLAPGAARALAEARTADDVVAALGRKVASQTPRALPPGALFLQPGEERRRSGSHYTPRELTEPIVRTTLRPVLEALGPRPTPEQILDLKVCDPAMGSGAFLVEACRQLAAALVSAWEAHDRRPTLPADEDLLLHARRLVAQRCLYGVDKNPFAVALARLSLWLVTLARDHAFTFLNHALKHGDSLVGLSKAQIGAFHWSPPTRDWGPLFRGVASSVDEAARLRGQIQGHGEGDYDARERVWRDADEAVYDTRLIGDLCVAAWFGADRDKERERSRLACKDRVDAWRAGTGDHSEILSLVDALRNGGRGGPPPVPVFHWEIEFPEVFGRDNPGFDAMVGNPPFAGKNTLSQGTAAAYPDWLKQLHPESHGNADVVAHFFRRAFSLIRRDGCFGLIATNTIGQGDTRGTGLRWICTHGGQIYEATRRLKWPGLAAVVVSVVHVTRGERVAPRRLDNREVPFISAFLFHGGGHEDPARLAANADRSFQGSIVLGMGFTFDDTDRSGAANPIAEMRRLIAKDPANAERIFPYIGGEEVNSSPTHAHHRYVINFGELSEAEARRWPDLMAIVEAKVKPARLAQNREVRARYWWRFGETTPALFRATNSVRRTMVRSLTSKYHSFAFLATGFVYDQTLIVVVLDQNAAWAVLSSHVHEVWSRFFGATMKDDPRYSIADCFETFPFPPSWQTNPALEAAGQRYYEFRAALMIRNDEGLTKTYNRFHDPANHEPDIVRLRALHAEMDRAVLHAYGWTDIPTDCEFLLDYEIDEQTWGDKKKPYRYRWPDAVRDEVLARLLDLNQRRHQDEQLAGAASAPRAPKPAPRPDRPARAPGRPRKPAPPATPGLLPFGRPTDDEAEDG